MTMAHPDSSHLAAYADGQLEHGAARRVEQHLSGCRQCQDEVAQQRALSAALRSFALPEGLGERTWERVNEHLPAAKPVAAPAWSGGFLRWTPPLAVFSATALLQAVPIVVLALTALSGLGLVNVRGLVTTWLPVDRLLPSSALQEAVDTVLSWPQGASLSLDIAALAERWGGGVTLALAWLAPSALAFLASAVLALLYLSWLAACWGRSVRQAHNGS